MDFMHYDLGSLQQGRIVEVALRGNVANVRLIDSEGFLSYKNGAAYQFVGGAATRSPVYLQVPYMGHWHLAIDMQGLSGSVTSAVRLMQNPPAAMRNLMSQIVRDNGKGVTEVSAQPSLKNKYHVFITYVAEDKGDLVRPLAGALSQKGVRAGFEEFEIKGGGQLCEPLERGLYNCRYGIFILSKNMIRRQWKEEEWASISAKILASEKPVFPIWHNVTEQEVARCNWNLARKPARRTAQNSIEGIASEIANIIMP